MGVDKVRVTTSKKDPEIRRAELAKALSPTLLKAIPAAASELAATSFGLQFLTEVLLAAEGDKTAALKAVAETAAGDPTYIQPVVAEGETSTEPPSHVAITSHGGKMIKSLIAGGRFDPKTKAIIPIEPALNFADILYPNIKDLSLSGLQDQALSLCSLFSNHPHSHRKRQRRKRQRIRKQGGSLRRLRRIRRMSRGRLRNRNQSRSGKWGIRGRRSYWQ